MYLMKKFQIQIDYYEFSMDQNGPSWHGDSSINVTRQYTKIFYEDFLIKPSIFLRQVLPPHWTSKTSCNIEEKLLNFYSICLRVVKPTKWKCVSQDRTRVIDTMLHWTTWTLPSIAFYTLICWQYCNLLYYICWTLFHTIGLTPLM